METKIGRVRFDRNPKGFAQLLRSPGVQRDLQSRANRIALAAGVGVKGYVWQGHDRARARVVTTTPDADWRQARYGTLSRAIDAGRG